MQLQVKFRHNMIKEMKRESIIRALIIGLCLSGFETVSYAARSIMADDLKCENLQNPLGIDIIQPRLSWILNSQINGQVQTAYQVLVASSPSILLEKKADMWNSGKVYSDQSIHVEYTGKELGSRDKCWWKVRVWDRDGNASSWSEVATFEIGLLSARDWKAEWIKSSIPFNEVFHPSPMLRTEFKLGKEIKTARLYISSLGLYSSEINGKRVGDQVFTPGWTSFHNRLQYQTYDVSSMLKSGDNVVGVTLGNGWYRAFIGFNQKIPETLDQSLDVIAQLEVQYTDGTMEFVTTDGSWKSSTGPIIKSVIYDGETYDARLETDGWLPAVDPGQGWQPGLPAEIHPTMLYEQFQE